MPNKSFLVSKNVSYFFNLIQHKLLSLMYVHLCKKEIPLFGLVFYHFSCFYLSVVI